MANTRIIADSIEAAETTPRRKPTTLTPQLTANKIVSKIVPMSATKAAFLSVMDECWSFSTARGLCFFLHSLQLPFEPLQRAGGLLGANGGLTLFTIAGAHQNDNSLHSFFDQRDIFSKLRALFNCKGIAFG